VRPVRNQGLPQFITVGKQTVWYLVSETDESVAANKSGPEHGTEFTGKSGGVVKLYLGDKNCADFRGPRIMGMSMYWPSMHALVGGRREMILLYTNSSRDGPVISKKFSLTTPET